jgi:hypothetical protein
VRRVAAASCLLTVALSAVGTWAQTDQLSLERAKVHRAKIEEAALRAVEGSVQSLARQLSSSDQMVSVMLQKKSAHQVRADSERVLRDMERAELRDEVTRQLTQFGRAYPDLPRDWVSEVLVRNRSRIDATVESLVSAEFPKRFAEARKRAVDSEAAAQVVFAEIREIEALAGADVASKPLSEVPRLVQERGGPVVQKYVAAALKGRVVFEENRATLEQRTTATITNAVTGLWHQLKLVGSHDGGGAIEKSAIEASILEGLRKMAGDGPIFPSARAAVTKRSRELEVEGFRRFVTAAVGSPEGCGGLPIVPARQRPPAPTDVPRDLESHIRLIDGEVRGRVRATLLDRYTAQVPEGAERRGLRDRLTGDMNAGPLAPTVDQGLRTCLERILRSYRLELARREVGASAPAVADLSLELNDAALEVLHKQEQRAEDRVLPEPTLYLEESRQLYRDNRRQLLEEGKRAIDRQVAIVEQRKPGIVAGVAKNRRTLEAWEREYVSQVATAWSADRPALLLQRNSKAFHPAKYDRLTAFTVSRIREILTPEFEKPRTETIRSERTSGGGGGQGGGRGRGRGPGDEGEGGVGGGGAPCPPPAAPGPPDHPPGVAKMPAAPWWVWVALGAAFALGGGLGAVTQRFMRRVS